MGIVNLIKKVMSIFEIKSTLDGLGIKTAASDTMEEKIKQWNNMYQDTGALALPSAICSELARLVCLELKTKVTGSKRAEFIDECYQGFISNVRRECEYALAGGGVIFKPYFDGEKIFVDTIKAGSFIPTAIDDAGKIRACAFLEKAKRNDTYYTRVEYHQMTDEGYRVCNYAYSSASSGTLGKRISLTDYQPWSRLSDEVTIANLKNPLFAYFKTPMANPFDRESPLGISAFAKAEGLIHDANEQYKRFLWEFESGERAVYVDEGAFKKDKNGKILFPEKRLYRALSTGQDEFFKDWTPTLREEDIRKGLNEILRKIEFTVGLAYGTLSDAQQNDKTAEEIKSSKQRSYATVCDIQNALKTALTDLIEAIDSTVDLYRLYEDGEINVSFEFDDSIIADRKTEFEEKKLLVSMGIMQPWELRAWYFGEDEETAKANLPPVDNEEIEI